MIHGKYEAPGFTVTRDEGTADSVINVPSRIYTNTGVGLLAAMAFMDSAPYSSGPSFQRVPKKPSHARRAKVKAARKQNQRRRK